MFMTSAANMDTSVLPDWDLDAALDLDLGLDNWLLASSDDFLEPLESDTSALPEMGETSPASVNANYAMDMDDVSKLCGTLPSSPDDLLAAGANMNSSTRRKRKLPESSKAAGKRPKSNKSVHFVDSNAADQLYKRRYERLHEILTAWNTGVIEDIEEIADSVYDHDVTLFCPTFTEAVHGVRGVLSHWASLLDAFPDGVMEEYTIHSAEDNGEKISASWVFSGTQIFPFFGVAPRREKVCIRGSTVFTFRGDKIYQSWLMFNQNEAMHKLMGQ